MKDFRFGPFEIRRTASIKLAGKNASRLVLQYGQEMLSEKTLPEAATQSEVIEAFADVIAQWRQDCAAEHAPTTLKLVIHGGETLATVSTQEMPDGMSGCVPDDRFPYWLTTVSTPTRGMPCSINDFRSIKAAPPLSWVAGLLPDDVLTTDKDEWRAPSSWEIRHIVGEGSLTGISGSDAAELVGISPQNFRKYTAAEGAKNRQNMSYATWHLLLHKLGVQSA